jgi:hypothetical protein
MYATTSVAGTNPGFDHGRSLTVAAAHKTNKPAHPTLRMALQIYSAAGGSLSVETTDMIDELVPHV